MIIFLPMAVTTEASRAVWISAPPNLILGFHLLPCEPEHGVSYIYTCRGLCIPDAAADNDVCACRRGGGSRVHAQTACDL